MTLQEIVPGSRHDRGYTFPQRLGSAFLWALGWWALAALGIGFLAATYVSIKVLWPISFKAGSAVRAPDA